MPQNPQVQFSFSGKKPNEKELKNVLEEAQKYNYQEVIYFIHLNEKHPIEDIFELKYGSGFNM